MQRRIIILFSLLLAGLLPVFAGVKKQKNPLSKPSLAELKQRLSKINAELEQLASFNLNGGVSSKGYQSKILPPGHLDLILIDLGEEKIIDQVILVPALWRDSEIGPRADGFPLRFRILAGTANATNVLASFTEDDHLLPRIAPLAQSFPPINASWVGIEIEKPSLGGGPARPRTKLSEILVFSGAENVALRQPVSAPNTHQQRDRNENFLVDGFMPYLMDAAQGAGSQAIQLGIKATDQRPELTMDLGATYPVNQINLHAIDQSRNIPTSFLNDYAIPRQLQITGANQPDFSDQAVLFEYEQKSIRDIGPILMNRFPETTCRYIRITALQSESIFAVMDQPRAIGFGEIEVLSNGRNVALDCPVTANQSLKVPRQSLARMTDGRNFFGTILSLRDWMNQLARRHDLETERPLVVAELNRRYERQKAHLRRVSWLAALLAAGTIITILIEQVIRQRAITRTRERIAANLHDELGANLHAIGLFGDLAKQEVNETDATGKWTQLVEYVEEIRTLTEHAGKTARYCTNMLEAKGLYTDLVEEMRRQAEHLQGDLEHTLSFENEALLQTLHPRRRIDLVLFYKECITNLIRHANATRAETCLIADKKEICLTVRDNGKGVTTAPPSLKRRARLLKAKLSVTIPADGGTEITLRLRTKRKN
jgi:signal transduction histidine kinase